MSTRSSGGCLRVLVGLGLIWGVAYLLFQQMDPPSKGPDCLERMQALKDRWNEREWQRVQAECSGR